MTVRIGGNEIRPGAMAVDRELVRRVVDLATRALSVLDTRPWRFVPTPAGLDLYADRNRQLHALDPTGRQLVLSCGAALGTARLAVRAFGFDCDVALLPDPDDVDHLARLVIGGPAVASGHEIALASEIDRSRTVPGRFENAPLTSNARAVLAAEAESGPAWLQWVDSMEHRAALAVLTDRADRIERADPAMRAELARWRHDAAGVPDASGNLGPRSLPPQGEHADLAVLCTRYDGPTSWLQAGEATTRVLLRAAGIGIAVSLRGQALDLPWTHGRLRAELGITGHPQLVLRLVRARAGPRSARRPAEEVLADRR